MNNKIVRLILSCAETGMNGFWCAWGDGDQVTMYEANKSITLLNGKVCNVDFFKSGYTDYSYNVMLNNRTMTVLVSADSVGYVSSVAVEVMYED